MNRAVIGERLAAVEREVAELRALLTTSDRAFLHAVALAVDRQVFTAAELLAHARHDAALADVLRGLSPKRIGKRLRSLVGREVGGLVLRRVERNAEGVVWEVQVISDLHQVSVAPDDGRA